MSGTEEKKKSNKLLWTIVTIVIAGLTIYTVSSSGGGISVSELVSSLKSASPFWLVMSIVSMLGYIYFEAFALHIILRRMGYRVSLRKSVLYSASDVYFSAITPSASGGQPASAFFMATHGISAAAITVALLWNVTMLAFSTLTIGIFCLVARFPVFMGFSIGGKALIMVGLVALVGLAALFLLLLKRGDLLVRIGGKIVGSLHKIHLVKRPEHYMAKLERMREEYALCESSLSGSKRVLFWVFIMNLAQRVSQISVTLFVHLALSGASAAKGFDLWITQGFALVGSNCIPIPGGMGAVDYLMINGFEQLFEKSYAFELQIISRALSFYLCILLAGLIVLVSYLALKRRKKKETK